MIRKRTTALSALAAFLIVLPSAGRASKPDRKGPGEERVRDAIAVIQEMADLDEVGLPEKILRQSHGIAVIPGVIKAAWGIGGQYGRGVLCVRTEEGGWSAPCFISIVGGSVGWQIGVEKADIILVFKTARSIDDISRGKVTLGAGAGIAAGPVGRNAEASTDLDMKAEIFSYSKSKGLFAGVSVKGASIQIDKDANAAFYGGTSVPAGDIFAGRDIQTPAVVDDLRKALDGITAGRT